MQQELSEPLYRGVTYAFEYQHTDGNQDLPLTGMTLYFTVKPEQFDESQDDATAIGETVTITPGSHTDASAGRTSWEWTVPATGVEPGDYYFDVVLQNSDGKKLPPVAIGRFRIEGKPTNRSV